MTLGDKVAPMFLFLFGVIYATSLAGQKVKAPEAKVETPEAGVVKIIAEVEGRQKIGTGFIVHLSRDTAYIMTASHVVEGDHNPRVEFFTSRHTSVPASIAGLEGGDPRGLALLLVRGGEKLPAGLLALPLALSAPLKGGDEVTVIGFPQMAGPWAVLKGNVVSRTGREIIFSGAIGEGASGGPMLKEGRVVGLVTGLAGQYGRASLADNVQLFLDGLGMKPSGVTQSPVSEAPPPKPTPGKFSQEKQATEPKVEEQVRPTIEPDARSVPVKDIQSLKLVRLDTPPFRTDPVELTATSAPDFTLKLVSAKANKTTDDADWVKRNDLPLPIYKTGVPKFILFDSELPVPNAPEAIPRSFQKRILLKAIRQPHQVLLVYGQPLRSLPGGEILVSFDPASPAFEYGLDFGNYAYPPNYPRQVVAYDPINHPMKEPPQNIEWAIQVEDILYVSHLGSPREANAYITALDLKSYRIQWRSHPLISNSVTFEIVGDYLITGYGTPDEFGAPEGPDFLYVLRRKTGQIMQKIPLKSRPSIIIRKGDNVFVRTYNTDYVFQISKK